MFDFLQERGARLTGSTLHKAAQGAASVGADLSMIYPAKTLSRLKDRIDVLNCLVKILNVEVNELDDDVGDPIDRSGYWGTPPR